ncbi:hypothetical protein T4A_6741 [Trichinella pseudospiralis]|uniref:Apple domain-containing protein n=1 Tax=Trichinella pseudospiralis TaxID=6337 RepID=A0A0V1DX07_TRIPS|nr:hypothetical protein T4A_6741 [Trichinella pseudospiralis]
MILYPRDQMYVILIISICFTTSEQTSFVAHFSDENLSCLLELRYLTQNETSALKKLPLSTLTDCIVACYMQNQSGFCNTVYFSKSRLMCYFIKQHENTFKSTDEEFRYLYYFIHKCTFGKKNLLNDETIKKKNCNFDTLKSHVILHDVSLICYLEQRSLEETKNAIAFRNLTSSSLLSCIFFCQQWYAFVHCNAVSFSLETGNCILYHNYVPTLQRSSIEGSSTKFYSVILCMDISIKVIAIELIKGTNLNFECSTEISPEQRDILLEDFERQSFYSSMPEWVEYAASFGSRNAFLTANLYEFLEICKIKEVDPRGIKNLTLYESHLRVDSLNTCLHKCRHAISEWPYRAVHYSSEKKFCYIYVKSSGTSVNVTLEANEQFVELQRCFSDRRSDRANNPDPLAFYIKGQGELKSKMKATVLWLIVSFNILVNTTKCNRITIYFPDVDMTCLLNVVPYEEPPDSIVLTDLSLGNCIKFCTELMPVHRCNRVSSLDHVAICILFYSEEVITASVVSQNLIERTFVIQKCKNGYSYNLDTDNFVDIIEELEIDFIRATLWKETCIVEIKKLLDLSNAEYTDTVPYLALDLCVFTCRLKGKCNAVLHDGNCTLYNLYMTNLTETYDENGNYLIYIHFCYDETYFVSIFDVAMNDLKYKRFGSSERTQSLNALNSNKIPEKFYMILSLTNKTKVEISDLRKITEKELNASLLAEKLIFDDLKMTVNIPTFFESCKIRITSKYSSDGIFPLRTHANVRSAYKCLELCRASVSKWPYRAVSYSKSNKLCTLIGSGVGIEEYNINNDEIFIELGYCYLDRFEERLGNPELLKFYVKETKEICVVEFYKKNCTSRMYEIKVIENTQSIDQCVSLCRIEQYSSLCTAFVFTMDKKCIVLGKTDLLRMKYIKPANSLLGEMLYCEEGDLADLIKNF